MKVPESVEEFGSVRVRLGEFKSALESLGYFWRISENLENFGELWRGMEHLGLFVRVKSFAGFGGSGRVLKSFRALGSI